MSAKSTAAKPRRRIRYQNLPKWGATLALEMQRTREALESMGRRLSHVEQNLLNVRTEELTRIEAGVSAQGRLFGKLLTRLGELAADSDTLRRVDLIVNGEGPDAELARASLAVHRGC